MRGGGVRYETFIPLHSRSGFRRPRLFNLYRTIPPPSPVPRLLPPPLPHLSSRYFRRLETNFPLKLLHLVGSPRRRYIGSLSYFGKFRCAGIVKPRFTMGLAKPAKRRLCVASTTGVLRTWDVYSQPKSIFQLTVSLVHFSSLLTY